MFTQSIHNNPATFSVHGITTLNMKFLASALLNMATYLIVLIQFKLADPSTLTNNAKITNCTHYESLL
jgi:hypothetical protein